MKDNISVNDIKTPRIKSIDIAKAIGIFLIVLGHVLTQGILRKFIYAFHVPLFFFLSGLCFSKKNNIKFFKKKVTTIYLPYILLSLISIFIFLVLGKYIDTGINTNLFDNMLGMLYANPNLENMKWNQPLWFLPCLFIQLITINIIENIISNNKHKNVIRIVIIICCLTIGIICSQMKIYLPFQLEAAMCMMIFTYIGIIIRENMYKIKQCTKIIQKRNFSILIYFIVTLVLSCILIFNNSIISVMDDKYGNYLIFFITSILMISDVMLISCFINRIIKKQKIISYIGQNTLIILLLHKFPILFFQELCPIVKDILNKNDSIVNNIIAIIISIIVILACMICKIIFDKIIRRIRNAKNQS